MEKILLVLAAIVSITIGTSPSCQTPTVSILRSYTTTDASVLTQIGFVSQFELKCSGSPPAPTAQFYAEVDGKYFNVARGVKPGHFQVSWTEEIPKASRGDYKINVYDEETFPQVKKAKVEPPAPLVTVTLNHPGAYSGPWLNSEHIAAILGVFVAYIAITCRSKLLS